MTRRRMIDLLFQGMSFGAAGLLVVVLVAIFGIIALKGARAMSWELVSQVPSGGFYLGGTGGIANAIVGSLYLGVGATVLALLISIPTVLYLRVYAAGWFAGTIRLLLDILWGVPSIVFGAFGFALMVLLGLKASLLAGMITVALFELPIMIRAIDEVVKMVPHELQEVSFALGATRFETAARVIFRQALPGVVTGSLLAFGRGIGDAASVLFTAGFTDNIPHGPMDAAATLPLAIFFQLGTPFEAVRQRAYSAALVLMVLVLAASILARLLGARFNKYTVK
ncbi:MAG TPA: phosphate ABC transporter permease PstA [Armatimonadota bacterium]